LVDALREEVLQKHILHADETPIKVLRADKDRKTHRAYLWVYAPAIHEGLNAVIYDFTPSRAGAAHARRKLYELHVANKSDIAAQALASFKALYAIETEAKTLTTAQRQALREEKAKLNGHDPLAYLRDILERLSTQPNHRIHELLPHHWQPAQQ